MFSSDKNIETIAQLIEAVKKDVDDFASGVPQYDDITMLCLFKK